MPMVNNINVYRDEAALPQPVLVYANAQGLRTLGHAAYIGVHAGQTQAAQQVVLHQPYRITEGAYDAANNPGLIKNCSRIGVLDGSNPPAVDFDFT